MFNFKSYKMNLENLNLVELNAQEVQEIDGGWLASLLFLIVIVAFGIIFNS